MDENYTEDDQDELGKKLETCYPILLCSFCFYPWANNHETEYTYNALYGEKYEKAKENVVKCPHLY